MPEQQYDHHCAESDRRGQNYSRGLAAWLRAQAKFAPGDMPYEAARRRARLAAETLDGLCDHCPYAGQEGGKPCE